VTDQAPHRHPRKRPARRTVTGPSEITGFTEGGTPSTSKLLAPVDGPERVNPGDEKNSDELSSYVFDLVSVTVTDRYRVGCSAIHALSDDVLIYIFNLYRQDLEFYAPNRSWSWHQWHVLAHVCQQWRHIIFAWPNYLDVRIDCGSRTAAVKALDVWPALPITIEVGCNYQDRDGIIGVLEHRDRIIGIDLSGLTGPQLKTCATLMQEPFSILQTLSLSCNVEMPPVISDMFLGGPAPRLQRIKLRNIPLPTLPKILLSTRGLVELHLKDIPSTGYISPDVMVTSLAMLTRLRSLSIGFRSRSSFPKNPTSQRPPPPTRTVLLTLTAFMFGGVSEYLEDLMARIDAPLLDDLDLQFFYQPTSGVPQLPQIIHLERFKTPDKADIDFHDYGVDISLTSGCLGSRGHLHLEFECDGLDRQLSLLEQVFSQCFPLLSHVGALELFDHDMQPDQDSTLWLVFLQPFNAVRTLIFLDQDSMSQIAHVLGDLTEERATEVLPTLRTIVWYGLCDWDEVEPWVIPLLQPFIDARELSGHPVEVP